MNQSKVISQLQSRIKLRSKDITEAEMWKTAYSVTGKRAYAEDTNKELAALRAAQKLDKKIIKTLYEGQYENQLKVVYEFD